MFAYEHRTKHTCLSLSPCAANINKDFLSPTEIPECDIDAPETLSPPAFFGLLVPKNELPGGR